jgi:hypothetical protein
MLPLPLAASFIVAILFSIGIGDEKLTQVLKASLNGLVD